MEVGLRPGDCVRWGASSPRKKGTAPEPIFGPFLLWPNGWMVQDATWHGGKPQPRRPCVTLGRCSFPKRDTAPAQFLFQTYCGQMAGWMKTPLGMEVDVNPGHILLDGDPAPPRKGHSSPPPSFRPMALVAMVTHLSYC